MKTNLVNHLLATASVLFISLLLIIGCRKNNLNFLVSNLEQYEQVNLVSDTLGFGAALIDSNLVNAWGIAEAPSGPIWISSNGPGLSTIYNDKGMTLRAPVMIPSPDSSGGGTPSGILFNPTTDFSFMSGETLVSSKFIFSTEDGLIAAWGGGTAATTVVNNWASSAVYKGIALANDGTANFLYATNFRQSRIDVFDKDFNPVSGKAFHDPNIPLDYGPFNIRNIGGLLYVTYAKHLAPQNHDDMAGPGNGFVDVYKPDGSWVKRFATHGTLNSPWGIVESTAGFSKETADAILIGNFGDGRINVFDKDGGFHGQLEEHGRPLSIDGLWAIDNRLPTVDSTLIYFTAGPDGENHSLFGYLQKNH
jgi:uncharacterized protein (TIGR03118 family)